MSTAQGWTAVLDDVGEIVSAAAERLAAAEAPQWVSTAADAYLYRRTLLLGRTSILADRVAEARAAVFQLGQEIDAADGDG